MADILRAAVRYSVARKRAVPFGTVPNLLLTTLVVAAAAAPFVPENFETVQRRPQVSVQVLPNLSLSTLRVDPLRAVASLETPARPTALSQVDAPNLLLTTLQPVAAAPFLPVDHLQAPFRQTALADALGGLTAGQIPARAEPFFAASSFERPTRQRTSLPDTSLAARSIPARAEPFFAASSFEPVWPRPPVVSENWSTTDLLLEALAFQPPFTPPAFESVWPAVKRVPPAESRGLPLVARPITLLFPPASFEQVDKRRVQRSYSADQFPVAALRFPVGLAPFQPPAFDTPQRSRKIAADWAPGSVIPFLPTVADPFKPLDVQRPLARRPVTFELPPNLQPLFAVVAAAPPIAAQVWNAPVEWTWTFNPALPVVARVDIVVPPALAGLPNYARWILVEAREKELLVDRRLHGILVEADGREHQS